MSDPKLITATIVQKNWHDNGKDAVLDCGTFELDSVDASGPPTKITLKGTSIPYTSKMRVERKSKAWDFIDEVITNLINDLMVQKGYTEVQAKNVVYSGGLKIYTTQDSYMQSILDTEFQNPENFPANTQIGLDWALTVEQADGEVQNYSKEMLQLYFRNSDPNFDLLFDSQEEAQSYIDQYKAAIMQEGDTIVAERSSFTPAAGVH